MRRLAFAQAQMCRHGQSASLRAPPLNTTASFLQRARGRLNVLAATAEIRARGRSAVDRSLASPEPLTGRAESMHDSGKRGHGCVRYPE